MMFKVESSRRQRTRLNASQQGAHFGLGDLAVIAGLQIQPDLGRPLEVAGEAQGGVRRDGAFALHDFIDAARRHADVMGETVFGQTKRREKILAENFTGMNGSVLSHGVEGANVFNESCLHIPSALIY